MNLNDYFAVLDMLFNIMPYAFWKDRKGIYRGANLNQVKAFGFSLQSEFVGKTIFEILADQESAKLIDTTDNKVMNEGISITLEESILTPYGQKIYLSQKHPMKDKNGNVIGLIGFSMDVTELKRQESLAGKERKKFGKTVTQMDALKPGKIERAFLLVSIELLKVITEKKYQYQESPIDFDYQCSQDSHFAFINVNAKAFKTMISNLIDNAVDALENKPGTVTTYLCIEEKAIKIIIKDDGKGMPKALIDKIMNNINVVEGKTDSHGIGLSQVREILQANEGKCAIESVVGKGTKVILTFSKSFAPKLITEQIKINKDDTIVILDNDSKVNTTPSIINDNLKNIDLVFLEDDKALVETFMLCVLKNKNVDIYYNPQDFLNCLNQYPKSTKMLIDNQFQGYQITGLEITRYLHENGFTNFYLYTGRNFKVGEVPSYLKVISKTDIDTISKLVE